jgi:tripartite-type tricarboxylate transporter receptor subunit TctC
MHVSPLTAALPSIQSGGASALAVTGAARFDGLPDVPTVGEFLKSYAVSLSPGLTQSESVCGYNCEHEVRR